MQTDVAETIFEIVKVMPEREQRKVLDFISELQDEDSSSLRSLFHEIVGSGKEIPDEVWSQIPSDGSINHDHYLYGARKRE